MTNMKNTYFFLLRQAVEEMTVILKIIFIYWFYSVSLHTAKNILQLSTFLCYCCVNAFTYFPPFQVHF